MQKLLAVIFSIGCVALIIFGISRSKPQMSETHQASSSTTNSPVTLEGKVEVAFPERSK